ncbi:MAG: 4-hydroxybenzoate 3-monooxygenase, partial [Gammaproteobacteria bacterium]|nr:4-hydroxybenzoate 3-monooxygenase [Gammaproteobacteria bacterium]
MVEKVLKTQVGIVGAGPAGLTLSRMLSLSGIDSIIIENQSRDYIQKRVRAGVLESGTVELLNEIGIGERMMREGMIHHAIELRFDLTRHLIDLFDLSGKEIMVYGQQEIVKDLVAAHVDEEGRPLLFNVSDVRLMDIESADPQIHFCHEGNDVTIVCKFIAGCDGFHGISRLLIPDNALTVYEHKFPFAWLGILAEAAPSTDNVIYANHERGFALHSMRSPEIVRNYLQCDINDDVYNWSDDQIWSELQQRMVLDDEFSLNEGKILEKGITPMRGFIVDPMQYHNLFLAGDAAHIVPPTGAKGLN